MQSDVDYSYPLYVAFREYGMENFHFEILEECAEDALNQREKFYIKTMNALFPHGYNQTEGGENSYNSKLNDDIVRCIIMRLKTSLDNSELIAKEFNISSSIVRAINRGECWRFDNEIYPIREHLEKLKPKTIYVCQKCGEVIGFGSYYCKKCKQLVSRKAERPTPIELAKLVKDLGFEAVGRQFNVSGKAVSKWCATYQIPQSKKELVEWYNKQVGIIESTKPTPKKPEDFMKKVNKLDIETGSIIATYNSVSDAARSVGKERSISHISDACRSGKTSYGYRWSFA